MSEHEGPDLNQIRDALRNHDERERTDQEDAERDQEQPAESEDAEDE